MAASYEYDPNKRFQSFTTDIGTVVFPHLNEPRDFEGDQKFNYDCGLTLAGDEAEALASFVDFLGEEAKKLHKKPKATPMLPYGPHLDKDKEEIPGETLFKFKVPAVTQTKKGEWDRKPVFFDAAGNPIQPEPRIGGGTKARIAFGAFLWKNPSGVGVKLQPEAIQIIELVERAGNSGRTAEGYGFGAVEGGFVAGHHTTPASSSAQQMSSESSDGADSDKPATEF